MSIKSHMEIRISELTALCDHTRLEHWLLHLPIPVNSLLLKQLLVCIFIFNSCFKTGKRYQQGGKY